MITRWAPANMTEQERDPLVIALVAFIKRIEKLEIRLNNHAEFHMAHIPVTE